MNDKEFSRQKQVAMDEMRAMNSRGREKETDENLHEKDKKPQELKQNNFNNSTFPIPFAELFKNGDTALLLGLLLILFSENADKRLLFALVYILL